MSAAIPAAVAMGIFEAIDAVVTWSQQERAKAKDAALAYAANPTPVKKPDLADRFDNAFDRATAGPIMPTPTTPRPVDPDTEDDEPTVIPDEYIKDDPTKD